MRSTWALTVAIRSITKGFRVAVRMEVIIARTRSARDHGTAADFDRAPAGCTDLVQPAICGDRPARSRRSAPPAGGGPPAAVWTGLGESNEGRERWRMG